MSTVEWIGNALPRAQVTTATPTAANTTVFTLTCNGKDASYTSDGSALVSEIVTGLKAAIDAIVADAPEWGELVLEDATTLLRITGPSNGTPFTVTSTGAGTIAVSTTTTATSPNHLGDTDNWSTGSLPVDSDTIIIANPVPILHDLDALDDVTPALLKIYASFWSGGASIGLPVRNPAGYNEYRLTKVTFLGATAVEIGSGVQAGGSGILNLDFMTGDVAISVLRTPQSSDADRPALALVMLPSNVANGTLEVISGSVGVGFYGETCKCTSKIGQASDMQVIFGTAVTHGATNAMAGGIVEINTATTVITKTGGTLTINGSGAHPTVKNFDGELFYNSTGALGASSIIVGGAAVLDFSQDMSTKTVSSTVLMAKGATLRDPHGVVTSLAFKPVDCQLDDVNVVSPFDKVCTFS